MVTLIRALDTTQVAFRQVVVFAAAFLLAETFYKFGSFTLELFAFLGTWGLLDGVSHALFEWLPGRQRTGT
ncbi:MAG TPA: hypothetical protein VGA69_10745 [Nitriliruptorales bacterium]